MHHGYHKEVRDSLFECEAMTAYISANVRKLSSSQQTVVPVVRSIDTSRPEVMNPWCKNDQGEVAACWYVSSWY